MLMMSFISLGIVTILWVLYGFSLAFGTDVRRFIGWNSDWLGLSGIGLTELWPGYTIPVYVFAVFQLMFAIITPALISGALADRVKFTRLGPVHRPVGHRRLLPGRPLGLGRRRLALQARRDRLRRRHRRPHQRRCRRPRRHPGHRQARRLQEGPDAPAQPAARHARRRPAVVRLVRLQRRLLARQRRRRRRADVRQHPGRHRRRDARLARLREASATAPSPPSAPPPAPSPASSPSPRPAAPSPRSARSPSASSPVSLAPRPSA